jgi:hypothetical protein
MSTFKSITERGSSSPGASCVQRALLVIFLIVVSIAAAAFLLSVFAKYRDQAGQAYAMFENRRVWLLLHLGAGGVGLLLGITQLITQWIWPTNRVHQWAGRAYLFSMLVACGAAGILVSTSHAPFWIRAAFSATGLAWISTAIVGFWAIIRQQIFTHRRWMIRNLLVALSPVAFRGLIAIPEIFTLGPPPLVIAHLIVLSWVVPLAIHEVVVRLTKQSGYKREAASA